LSKRNTSQALAPTTQRIVAASMKLFNERGFQSVAALQIAKHMGMSSGNLAYHFKSKSEIISAVFPLLERAMRDAKERDGPFLPSNAAKHLVAVSHTLWQYRFLFNALPILLAEDAALRKRYTALEESTLVTMADLYKELIHQKYMRAIAAPNSPRLLAKAAWLMYLSWVRCEHIRYPKRQTVRKEAVYEAVTLHWSMLQSYFPPEFAAQWLTEVKKQIAVFDRRAS
jgi:AcrR family transcriptional regulator